MSDHTGTGAREPRGQPARDHADGFMPSPSIRRRREAAAAARRRRTLLTDALIALGIVLFLLIVGLGVGMLGVIAVLALLVFFAIPLGVGTMRRRRRWRHLR